MKLPISGNAESIIFFVRKAVSGYFMIKSLKYLLFLMAMLCPESQFGKDLIYNLYKVYGADLTSYIKGNFTIVLAREDSLLVFNDHLAIKKFFYTDDVHGLIISNQFKYITNIADAALNLENLAIHALYNHFVGGVTIARNIHFTDKALLFRVNDVNSLSKSTYWELADLFKQETAMTGYEDYVSFFSEMILDYINYTNSTKISLSLTGGLDSRLILSTLLNHGIKPSTYTFGNPRSSDVSISSKISETFNLDFLNHYLVKPDPSWFTKMTGDMLSKLNWKEKY